MDIAIGDIIRCNVPIADHAKYHICVLDCGDEGRSACFLFLNSKQWGKGDCVFSNDSFPCIPPSETGVSIVSFSLLVRYNAKQLKLYRAQKVGRLLPAVARELEAFAKNVPTLTTVERKIVLSGLAKVK